MALPGWRCHWCVYNFPTFDAKQFLRKLSHYKGMVNIINSINVFTGRLGMWDILNYKYNASKERSEKTTQNAP